MLRIPEHSANVGPCHYYEYWCYITENLFFGSFFSVSLAESEVLPGWEGDSYRRGGQAEIIPPPCFVPQEAWYEKGSQRADPTRPQQRHRNVVGWSRQKSVARRGGVQSCLGLWSSRGTSNSSSAASFLLPDKLQRQTGSPHCSSTRGLKRQS